MIIRSTASSAIRFLWRDTAYLFSDPERAIQFMAGFKGDPGAMAGLRRLLDERDWLYQTSRMNDDAVIKAVAELLGKGELVAGVEWKPRLSAPPQPEAAAPAAGPSAPSSTQEEPDPNTFNDNDGAAQAAALINAAQSGVPFCEECARLAAQRAGAL